MILKSLALKNVFSKKKKCSGHSALALSLSSLHSLAFSSLSTPFFLRRSTSFHASQLPYPMFTRLLHAQRIPGSSGSRPRRLCLPSSDLTGSLIDAPSILVLTLLGCTNVSGLDLLVFYQFSEDLFIIDDCLHQITCFLIFTVSSRLHIHSSISFVSPFQGPLPGDPPNLLVQFAPLPPLPLSLPSSFHSFIPVSSSITVQMRSLSILVGLSSMTSSTLLSHPSFTTYISLQLSTGLHPHSVHQYSPGIWLRAARFATSFLSHSLLFHLALP